MLSISNTIYLLSAFLLALKVTTEDEAKMDTTSTVTAITTYAYQDAEYFLAINDSAKPNGTISVLPTTSDIPLTDISSFTVQQNTKNPYEIRIGLLFVKNSSEIMDYVAYQSSASAVVIAVDRLQSEDKLTNYTFSYKWYFDECEEKYSVGYTTSLLFKDDVDVIIGPSCAASIIVGNLVRNYNFPLFIWGMIMPSSLTDLTKFPTVVSPGYSNYHATKALISILIRFQWQEFAFIYSSSPNVKLERCTYIHNDLESALNEYSNISISYNGMLTATDDTTIATMLTVIQSRARIVVLCLDTNYERRSVMKHVALKEMTSNEFVFLFIETQNSGFGKPEFWKDESSDPDNLDSVVQEACAHVLIADITTYTNGEESFYSEVLRRMSEPPFNCTTECEGFTKASKRVTYLADAVYIYGTALDKLLKQNGTISRDGRQILEASKGYYSGWSGNFNVNNNGYRNPVYSIYGLNAKLEETVYVNILMNTTEISWVLFDQYDSLWANWGGHLPLAVPVCDFDNSGCPPAFMQLYGTYVILGIVIIVVVLIMLLLSVSYVIRSKVREQKRLDELWQISFMSLVKPNQKKENGQKSTYSLQGAYLNSSVPNAVDYGIKESDSHVFLYLHGEPVVAIKHISRPKITKNDAAVLRMIRQQDRNNLNKFLGLCTDGNQYLSVWKYCSRGSLKDVIGKGTLNIDSFFMLCIMRDIIEVGLCCIHNSIVEFHGHLTSASCLVNERWQVKINDYGLRFIKQFEGRPEKTLLWTAPELLREGDNVGSKEGDIYSFAIICSEIVTKKLAFNYMDREESIEELVFKIKRRSPKPYRPDISGVDTQELNSSVLDLIQECWSEDPKARPKSAIVKQRLDTFGRKGNLLDHVFNMMEEYAQNLEDEVEQRTKELVEEQKKSDRLLYRMLPKQVAELLKRGETVAPESFDAATVFFSDVVKFTELARKCTPLQVVNLLNDLYTIFDNIIEECGVYKVETIGDGYLCVSGLPRRNGNDHAKEVAEMAFQFLRKLKFFRIPHLPDERVKIRIGIHTGPVVAGIIGQTMPRYCLFGDTVNTASRMESNGKSGRIHISPQTNHYLTELIGGYVTESRGEILVKGKGVMETFWLLPPEGYAQLD